MFDPFNDIESAGYLRNRFREQDPRIIKRIEHELFIRNLKKAVSHLANKPTLSYEDFLAVHKILFGEFYSWAGQDRLATAPHLLVSKAGTQFCEPPTIRLAVDQGLRLAQHQNRMPEAAGEIMGLFAYGHPFLDGNGRTMLIIHMELAHRAGFSVDWPATTKTDYLSALAREIEWPGRGILDQYLQPFVGPQVYRGQLVDSAVAMRGLDGLDDENQIEGDLRDESVAEKYRQFDKARNYSYQLANVDQKQANDIDQDNDEDQEPGPSLG